MTIHVKWWFEPKGAKPKKQCPKGHPKIAGERWCNICAKERMRKLRERRKKQPSIKRHARFLLLAFLFFSTPAYSQSRCTTEGLNFCVGDKVIPTPGQGGLVPKSTAGGDCFLDANNLCKREWEGATGTITDIAQVGSQWHVKARWGDGLEGWTSDLPTTVAKAPDASRIVIYIPPIVIVPYQPILPDSDTADFTVAITWIENLPPDTARITFRANFLSVLSIAAGSKELIKFSATGLPTGLTGTFFPSQCLMQDLYGCESMLTVKRVSSDAPQGNYTVIVTAEAVELAPL